MEWIDIREKIPQPNVLVKVRLTNGVEAVDFVNEPICGTMPFQHYHVSAWREFTREELCNLVKLIGLG